MLLGSSIKSVFVTGGAGFIGSHLVDRLIHEGYQVGVIDDLSNGREEFIEQHFSSPNFEFISGNIRNIEDISDHIGNYDLVWHLASNTDIIDGYSQPRRDLLDCVVGTFNVLESMRLTGVKEIIFSSTGAVYGDLCAEAPARENIGPLLPLSNYAAGKIGSEAFISAYCHLYGLNAWMFRFGNVIGGRMTHGVIVDFIERLKKDPEELIIYGDGRQAKNYFLVEECIEGMAYAYRNVAIDNGKPCSILNLGSESVTKVTSIANIVTREMGIPRANITIEGSERAWPGDQPRVNISVELMKHYGWTTKLSSDEAVTIAVRRMLGEWDQREAK